MAARGDRIVSQSTEAPPGFGCFIWLCAQRNLLTPDHSIAAPLRTTPSATRSGSDLGADFSLHSGSPTTMICRLKPGIAT
jgi:hypothetical protein